MSKRQITEEAFNQFVRAKLNELDAQRIDIETRMEALRIALSVATGETFDAIAAHQPAKRKARNGRRKSTRSAKDTETVTRLIVDAIRDGKHTAPEIARHGDLDAKNIAHRLRTREDKGIVKLVRGKWVLA